MSVNKIWNRLFLQERPSIGLSFFRIPVALTVGFHVIPSFFHLDDNYFSTALKTINGSFFTPGFLSLVQKSSDHAVLFFVGLFLMSWLFFLVGFYSQVSCIVMTVCCYYFYALNAFQIGTLSWDILLVTLFLMCITNYHGDYFSIDALRRRDEFAFQRPRPFFLQRLLQLQIAFTFFYTGLSKISAHGNWLTENPIYFLANYPIEGVTKTFLFKEWLAIHPGPCYAIGLFVIAMEMSLPFLLFYPATRRSAIYMGFMFHAALILTLDVPAIFFFLFPFQLLLFFNPHAQVRWINAKRTINMASPRFKVVYDGGCQFCQRSVEHLKVMDLFSRCEYIDFHTIKNFEQVHSSLNKELATSQMHLITPDRTIYGGFFAFRQLAWLMPMMYPLLFLMYLPGASWAGSGVYRFIAKNRYLFHFNRTCQNNRCFRS
jgi:predicted DCC family thiol-disulfide oxidoreductase YuxK